MAHSFKCLSIKKVNEFLLEQQQIYKINVLSESQREKGTQNQLYEVRSDINDSEKLEIPPHYEESKASYNSGSSMSDKSNRRHFSKEIIVMLRRWFNDHLEDPYPSQEEKIFLAKKTDLSIAQVNSSIKNSLDYKLVYQS